MIYTLEVQGVGAFEAAIQALPAVVEVANLEAMELSVRTVEAAAKERVPRKTGRLFSSITAKTEVTPLGVQGKVGTDVDYARPVEFGSGPHEIVPVTALALCFPIDGRNVFAARVHHPGSRPHPFLGPALEESKAAILGYFRAAVDKVVARLARG